MRCEERGVLSKEPVISKELSEEIRSLLGEVKERFGLSDFLSATLLTHVLQSNCIRDELWPQADFLFQQWPKNPPVKRGGNRG